MLLGAEVAFEPECHVIGADEERLVDDNEFSPSDNNVVEQVFERRFVFRVEMGVYAISERCAEVAIALVCSKNHCRSRRIRPVRHFSPS